MNIIHWPVLHYVLRSDRLDNFAALNSSTMFAADMEEEVEKMSTLEIQLVE